MAENADTKTKAIQPSTESDANPERKERPDNEFLGIEIGVETNLPFSAPYQPVADGTKRNADEELQEILRDESEEWGPTVRQLITMRRMDGQARALYRLLTLPVRAALEGATFVAEEGGEPEQEFIDQVFNTPGENGGMTVTFQRFMAQLLQGLFDGFSAFEKVIWMPEYGPLKGKYTLKKLAHRPSETVTFVADKNGGFAGFRQRAYNSGKAVDVYIPTDYAFYYAAQEEERKFYGVSFFQAAFYHYDKKVKLYYTAHLAAQRAAVGTRVGTVPQSASQTSKREFATALSNLALAQYMMVPDGYKVELLKESGGFDFMNLINHHNSQMSKSILAGFFDDNQGAGNNDSSLVNFAKPGDDMFILMLRGIMDDIASSINHFIIPQLIDYNFDSGKYPTFTWGKFTDEQKAAIGTLFDKLATTAATSQGVTPEFMRAIEEEMAGELGLDVDYDEVDARIEQEQQMQQQLLTQGAGGVDANGNPIPADPNAPPAPGGAPGAPGGAPAAPGGAPAPAPGNDPISKFTKQIASLSADDEEDENTLRLMQLAGELLEASETVELASPRRVKTPQGQKKYGEPVGHQIQKDTPPAEEHPITLERLNSLLEQINQARKVKDKGLLAKLSQELEGGLRNYAKGRDPKAVLAEINGSKKDG